MGETLAINSTFQKTFDCWQNQQSSLILFITTSYHILKYPMYRSILLRIRRPLFNFNTLLKALSCRILWIFQFPQLLLSSDMLETICERYYSGEKWVYYFYYNKNRDYISMNFTIFGGCDIWYFEYDVILRKNREDISYFIM